MPILTIVQNLAKLPYLEITFLETSYLSVFGLSRPIVYRPDNYFEFFCRFCISLWCLTSGKKIMVIHPVAKSKQLGSRMCFRLLWWRWRAQGPLSFFIFRPLNTFKLLLYVILSIFW